MFTKVILFIVGCFFVGFISATPVVVHSSNTLRHTRCRGVDYPGLGCFSRDAPYTNTRWLPQSPAFVATTFLLYTRDNPQEPDHLAVDQSISQTHFNGNNPTKILVHGFLQHRQTPFLTLMTRELLEEASMNVIIVGWSGGAGFPYGQAVANTRLVGAQIAQLVTALTTHTGLELTNVHIIGHSLGAHVAGYAGARLQGVGRITALDPAQPNYHGYDPEVRLDPTDAMLVDVIHTDGVPYDTVQGYGMVEPVGHIDFYPNGGHYQPGCHEEDSVFGFVEDALTRGIASAERGLSCSHERSTALFIASISRRTSCHFTGFPCASEESFLRGECTSCGNIPCPTMGYQTGIYTRARGVFYLNTTSSAPFCGHHHLVTVTLSDTMENAVGSLKVKVVGQRGQIDWMEVATGSLNAGDVLPKIILSQSQIGDVTSLEVLFTKDGGYFSWSSDRVILRKVEIASPIQGIPTTYCQPDMFLQTGQPITLTGDTHSDTNCL